MWRSVARSRRWWRRMVRCRPAGRLMPSPIASLARRTPESAGPRSSWRPRVGRGSPVALPAAPRSACGGGGQCGGAHRPVSGAGGPGCRPDPPAPARVLGVDPIGQPRGGLPQRALRAGRQREQQRRRYRVRPSLMHRIRAGTGACRQWRAILVPVMPYDDTAARRGVSGSAPGHGVILLRHKQVGFRLRQACQAGP